MTPRRSLIRCFVTATHENGGHLVMPGGLIKTASTETDQIVNSRLGAESKDAWVMGSHDGDHVSLWTDPDHRGALDTRHSNLPSRAGENLFWTGRYTARTEGLARMLRHALNSYVFDAIPGESTRMKHLDFVTGLIQSVTQMQPLESSPSAGKFSAEELSTMLADASRPGSIASNLRSLQGSFNNVKDLWSADILQILNKVVDYSYTTPPTSSSFHQEAVDHCSGLILRFNAFIGLTLESMTRDAGWLLLDAGRRVEQAQLIAASVRHCLHQEYPDHQEALIHQGLLVSLDSLVTYRRTFASQIHLAPLLQLTLLDENNPRSLFYQVRQLEQIIDKLPLLKKRAAKDQPLRKQVDRLLLHLHEMKVDDLVKIDPISEERTLLHDSLSETSELIDALSSTLDQLYFSHSESFTAFD